MLNNIWCDNRNITVLSGYCVSDLELITVKCRAFYPLQEFTSIIMTSVYIPPEADTDAALTEQYQTINKLGAMTEGFSQASLKMLAAHLKMNTKLLTFSSYPDVNKEM